MHCVALRVSVDRFEVMEAFGPCPAASPFSPLTGVDLEKQQCECAGATSSLNRQKEQSDLAAGGDKRVTNGKTEWLRR